MNGRLLFPIALLRATHLEEYQRHPSNGKTVTVTGISIFQIVDGKIQDITVTSSDIAGIILMYDATTGHAAERKHKEQKK